MNGGHRERHLIGRIGWLRAAVLGANDGIISTASLIVGVAAGSGGARQILLTGIAGLVAGSMSMASWRSWRRSTSGAVSTLILR